MAIQGSNPYLQGSSIGLQGSAPPLQGSPIQLNQGPTSGTIALGNAQQAVSKSQPYIDAAQNQLAAQQKQIQSLLASLRPTAPAPVDIAAINAQARKQAEESVNPLYTKKLNDMLARQAVQRQRAQQDYSVGIQSIEDQLKQAQESNTLDRTRTAEDVATNTGQINTLEDQFQTGSGQQFDDQRLAEAQQLAASGLTSSGIGRQQAQRTLDQRNLSEQQQTADFQAQRSAQAVLKARNFEDLAKSDVLVGQRAEKGKQAAKLDLDRLIEDVNSEESSNRFSIEQSRLGDVANQTSGYSQLAFNNYLASIRDPRVLAATAQAYGGLF